MPDLPRPAAPIEAETHQDPAGSLLYHNAAETQGNFLLVTWWPNAYEQRMACKAKYAG